MSRDTQGDARTQDERDEARLRALLLPGPPRDVPPFDALASRRAGGSLRRGIPLTLATVLVAIAALVAGQQLSAYRQQLGPAAASASPASSATQGANVTANLAASASPSASPAPLPRPIVQPITKTGAAAQVAWIDVLSNPAVVVGVDPTGRIVGSIDRLGADGYYRRFVRSADGEELIAIDKKRIAIHSASDGSLLRTLPRDPADGVVDAAVSPDGRWLAIIGAGAYVQVVDLATGVKHLSPLAYSNNPSTPGLSGTFGPMVWSTLSFSPDSRRLATIVNWGGPMWITVFDTTTGFAQVSTAVDGKDGHRFSGCAGPGLATRIRPDGRTLVTFCYLDGGVQFIDLETFAAQRLSTDQPNPFWQAPIFTPDGQILYLHQYAGFGDEMTAVDLTTRRVAGKRPTPKNVGAPGIFSWLFPIALAGGTPSTNPVSPDGLRMYSVASDGITVLRIPDLAPIARLADGLRLDEVWVSGDGKTVYATAQLREAGKPRLLYVMPADGSRPPIAVTLDGETSVFYP